MKTNKKTILSLFLIQCIWPVCFYIAYILCGNILKTNFEYSAADVIRQNFYVSMIYLLGLIFLTYLNYKIYPLKVLKVQLYMYFIFSLTSPYLLNHASSVTEIFIIQILTMLLRPDISSAIPIFFKHFPIFKRFRATSYIFAIVHALMHIVNTLGLMYLVKIFGNWGLVIITIPIGVGYAFGLDYFIKLEKDVGNYPKEPFVSHAQKAVV